MTVPELEQAGTELFGQHWKTALSEALGVDVSTLRRWLVTGKIPHMVGLAIMGLYVENGWH
jgi:hypothetical protein